MGKKIKLAVLLSGGGRTLQNIIDHIKTGKLTAEVELVIGSRPDASGKKESGLFVFHTANTWKRMILTDSVRQ
jgi:folate-dependent phosphoribosylglycinamide formyltransferase PurN